jgi:hypothetical protein
LDAFVASQSAHGSAGVDTAGSVELEPVALSHAAYCVCWVNRSIHCRASVWCLEKVGTVQARSGARAARFQLAVSVPGIAKKPKFSAGLSCSMVLPSYEPSTKNG